MYVKIDGELKSIKRIELKSDATTILIHTITEKGLEEEYKCFSDSPNYYHLSADIYIISDIFCSNKEHIIQMTLILLRIDNQLQCILGLTLITGTKNFMVTNQSTNNNQIKLLFARPNQLIILSLKLYSRTFPRITLKVRTEIFKRLFKTNIFIPGDLEGGSAELII